MINLTDGIQEMKQKARQKQLDFENQMKKSEEEFRKELDKRLSKIKKEPIFEWKRRKSTL